MKRERPITIKQLARQAGVSVASVSRALNQQPGVSESTRERICAMAQELGYAPDSRARALVTGEVPFVGLVVPDITNPFYPEVARGAEQALEQRGLSLLLVSTDWQQRRLEHAFNLLWSHHVCGLMLAAPLNGLLRSRRIDWSRLSQHAVVVGRELPQSAPPLRAVVVDDEDGGEQVGRHLLAGGWRRLAYLGGPEGDRSSRRRLSGLRRALRGSSSAQLTAVRHGGWSVQSGLELARELLAGESRPDALFAANDLIALGAAQAAARLGLRLGRDLALVGYDDIDTVQLLDVPLTSVAQPKRELGQRAAELLGTDEEPQDAAPSRLKPRLVVRRSSGGAG